MRNIRRSIEEVRTLRGDLSSYLIHLTRNQDRPDDSGNLRYYSAKSVLEQILTSNMLRGLKPVGQFSHHWYKMVKPVDLMAVCLTETPIEHIHLFVGIQGRALNFDSYGLVFDKIELARAPIHAAPVLYFSQPESRDFHFVDAFSKLERSHYGDFKDILYLFDRFGKDARGSDYDWRWEREWRIKGQMNNVGKFVKFGLCPENEIGHFESKYAPIKFVDPFFNPGQIRAKLKLHGIL